MRRRPSVYLGVIHIFALIGVVQCIRLVAGINADPPPRIEVRVQGVIAPGELPVLPDGGHKSEYRAEQLFIDNEPVGRFWFRDDQLTSMEFCPPGELTLHSLKRERATDVLSDRPGAHWTSSTDTVGAGENPWSDFPTLTVRDASGLGVPNLAIIWDGTSAKRTLRGQELWDELAGLSNAGELPESEAGENAPGQ